MERPLTEHIRADRQPLDLAAYERTGGYDALKKAITSLAPGEIVQMVRDARLNGRGGAGFDAGHKWSFLPPVSEVPPPRYVAINGDEMEPGSFKDRLLLESNPHMVIEGAILAGYAVQANIGYIFVRWAYHDAHRAIRRALEECYQAGYLGDHILGSDFGMHIYLHESAGRYVAGEASALLNAIEGERAIPRFRPPHMATLGLWGKPTIVNNVETISNVPHIVARGPRWFRGLSRIEDEGGTKLFGMSGKVKAPGLWELPLGTTLREVLEDHAGGMRDGLHFRGALPGGASSGFLGEENLDVQLAWSTVEKVGTRLGTGSIIVMDDRTCPVGMVLHVQKFFARESCGWCSPCREGLPWVVRLLSALERGEGTSEDLEVLESQGEQIKAGVTFCELAPGAMESLRTAIAMYREDFERHVSEHRCPWRSS